MAPNQLINVTVAEKLSALRIEETRIEFIDENGGGPGVRLRKRPRAELAKR